MQPTHPSGSITNAHDWVWLGRTSLGLHPSLEGRNRISGANPNRTASFDGPGGNIRIITNPNFSGQSLNAEESGKPGRRRGSLGAGEDSSYPPPLPPKQMTSGSSSLRAYVVDSATYSVNKGTSGQEYPGYRPPVPPHRNVGQTAAHGTERSPLSPGSTCIISESPLSSPCSSAVNSQGNRRLKSRKTKGGPRVIFNFVF